MKESSPKPLITAVLPTYRRPKLLRRAIKSILSQNYPHFQICVCDNASGDETAAVVAELAGKDSRVKYYCHPDNIGGFANLEFGLKNVQTPFFSILSDDDILLPEFYEVAIKGFDNHPEAAFYATAVLHMNPAGTIVAASNSTWGDGYYLPPEGVLDMYKNGRYPPTWTGTLFRTMVIKHVGLMDPAVGLPIDGDYLQRIAIRFPYGTSKIPGAIFLMNPDSVSAKTNHAWVWPCWLKMIPNLIDGNHLSLSVQEQIRSCLTQALILQLVSYGKRYVISRKYNDACEVAKILSYHLNAKLWAFIIYITSKCCLCLPYFHSMLLSFAAIRRHFILNKCNASIPDAGKYAHYFKEM